MEIPEKNIENIKELILQDIEELIKNDIEEDYNDPDYQQYIEMCRQSSKNKKS